VHSDIRRTDERELGVENGELPMVSELEFPEGLKSADELSANDEPKRLA
jgi:hypothetical protein